tara:strand:+ start:296 stop:406 length:111 start_codon:yes stop_codon:yes gene_type:complete
MDTGMTMLSGFFEEDWVWRNYTKPMSERKTSASNTP